MGIFRDSDPRNWMAVATPHLSGWFGSWNYSVEHTRSTLVQFGAEVMIPTLQSASFFNELGPLVTGLLVAGRVGAGIGAGIANMRVTEQIDAIESLSVDAFKMLVVTRIVACILILPMLTVFMDFAGLAGGFLSEYLVSHISCSSISVVLS
jgi:phospholipid/cholesterol/gamma-HCH transport system permease protein